VTGTTSPNAGQRQRPPHAAISGEGNLSFVTLDVRFQLESHFKLRDGSVEVGAAMTLGNLTRLYVNAVPFNVK
jgi:hypothetical protein